jgi:hypothetical protein
LFFIHRINRDLIADSKDVDGQIKHGEKRAAGKFDEKLDQIKSCRTWVDILYRLLILE